MGVGHAHVICNAMKTHNEYTCYMEPATEEREMWGGTDTKQNHEDSAGKLMNLCRPVPNANEKQQFCQIVKILVFNKCRKRWHMRKNSQKTLKKHRKTPGTGGKTGKKQKKTKKTTFFFHLTTWRGTYC